MTFYIFKLTRKLHQKFAFAHLRMLWFIIRSVQSVHISGWCVSTMLSLFYNVFFLSVLWEFLFVSLSLACSFIYCCSCCTLSIRSYSGQPLNIHWFTPSIIHFNLEFRLFLQKLITIYIYVSHISQIDIFYYAMNIQ